MPTIDSLRSELVTALTKLGDFLEEPLNLVDDYCTLSFDGDLPLVIRLTESADGEARIILAAIVAENIAAGSDAIPTLLEYSWLGLRTGGNALSWDSELESALLWTPFSAAEINAETLRNALESLIGNAMRVRDELRGYADEPSATKSVESSTPPLINRA